MTLFLIIFKQEQNAISCKPASPRRVSFCRYVRVRFIEEEHQAQNALCCIPVAPRRVSFLPFRERKVYRRGKSGTQRIMLYPGSSKKGIFFSFRESKVNRKEDVPGCKDEYNKLHLKGKSRKAQYVT
jgi:hypothetical protein